MTKPVLPQEKPSGMTIGVIMEVHFWSDAKIFTELMAAALAHPENGMLSVFCCLS